MLPSISALLTGLALVVAAQETGTTEIENAAEPRIRVRIYPDRLEIQSRFEAGAATLESDEKPEFIVECRCVSVEHAGRGDSLRVECVGDVTFEGDEYEACTDRLVFDCGTGRLEMSATAGKKTELWRRRPSGGPSSQAVGQRMFLDIRSRILKVDAPAADPRR